MRRVLGGSVLVLLPLVAGAVTPPEGLSRGAEPVRVRTFERGAQSYWSRQAAWTDFRAGQGRGWSARFDEITGTPHRAWGPGIALGPLPDAAAAERAVLDFVHSHPELLGVGEAEVVVRSVAWVDAVGAWYVDVDTRFDGHPVWRGGLTFRIAGDRLVMFGAETYADAPRVGRARLGPRAALDAFVAQGPAAGAEHRPEGARLVWLPQERAGRVTLRLVWEVQSRTTAPQGAWEAFVDADTGALVGFHDRIRYLAGRLEVEHDVRLGDGTLTTSPLRHATVVAGEAEVVTDASGAFAFEALPPDQTPGVLLRGPRARIRDELGTLTPAVLGGDQLLVSADFADRLAAPSAFVWVQAVQDFARSFAPEVDWVDDDVRVVVNVEGTCNAWYDGTLNFLQAGDGCRNTGRLADVIFHEWGHGFHAESIVSGVLDGSVGEGAADLMSAFLNDDSRIAPFFFDNGSRALRDARNRATYADDFRADAAFVHSNGTIFSGSMWDAREALRAEHGEPYATDTILRLYAGLLKAGPDIVTTYDEALFVDDDDADLGNGTPHQCALVEGFGRHGLGPLGGFGTAPEIPVPVDVAVGEDVVVEGTVPNPAPACVEVSPERGALYWRVPGRDWTVAWVTADGLDVRATIPADRLSWGDVVEYYVEIETSSGGTVFDPPGGPIRPHTFYVGDVLEVGCQDFEADDGGYRHELVEGEDQEGADDWQWGPPGGAYGDPALAGSGVHVWGTDLGGQGWDGAYQNDKQTRLRSPELPTAHYEGVVLRYLRWLTVEDGVYDQARILADGVEVWANHASAENLGTEHHLDDRWASHVVPLAGQGDDGEVRLTWEITTDPGFQAGGWNLDDVCLYAPATADNRLGITNLTVAETDRGVALAWTHPKHAPVRTVRVVRTRGGWPDGAHDGEVVWEASDVVPGAPAGFVDEGALGPDLYYAVYGFDGERWLSWTREGFNAAAIDPLPTSTAGCGCDAGAGGATGSVLGLLLGVAALRRRRR